METLLQLLLAGALIQAPAALDTAKVIGPVRTVSPAAAIVLQPLGQEQPQLVEYSNGYTVRATIHKYASYTMLPVFAAQFYTGSMLMRDGDDAPEWARHAHGPLATGVAALFTVNTVTGLWNLWEARKDPEERTRRTLHGLLMLAADAGFAATGLLAEDAEESGSRRDLHRTVALSSMGVAALSYTIMLPFFRKD